MADEAAYATSWLCRNDIDGATVLANHLNIANALGVDSIKLHSLNWPWTGGSNGLCALSAGASISDLATSLEATQFEMQQVISAALVLPYFALVSQYMQPSPSSSTDSIGTPSCITNVRCEHFDAKIIATPTKSWLSKIDYRQALAQTQPHSRFTDVQVEFGLLTSLPLNAQAQARSDAQTRAQLQAPPPKHRTIISTEALTDLNRFAQNTYAPATDASRQGAGPGETDND